MRRFAVLIVVVVFARIASADHVVEVGAAYGSYSDNLGHSDSEFAAYTWSGAQPWLLRIDVGRESRFDDQGLFLGGSVARQLGAHQLSAGLSSGTGDVIHPEYRCDLGGIFALPVKGLQATAGYTRMQSKSENSSDGFHYGLVAWLGGHWILGAAGHHEIGHPGDTVSNSGDVSVTWYRWLRLYVGAGYRFGAVSYQLIGPSTALVDYDETAVYGTLSWYLRSDLGVNARLDVLENDVYDLTAVRVSLFKQW